MRNPLQEGISCNINKEGIQISLRNTIKRTATPPYYNEQP